MYVHTHACIYACLYVGELYNAHVLPCGYWSCAVVHFRTYVCVWALSFAYVPRYYLCMHMASSDPKKQQAIAFVNSVFPTLVGPEIPMSWYACACGFPHTDPCTCAQGGFCAPWCVCRYACVYIGLSVYVSICLSVHVSPE